MNILKQNFLTLTSHVGFMRYFKNSAWMMGEQLLRMIAGLLIGVWVARYLGPEQFGLLSYVLAFTAIFGGIAKVGLDGIIVRELVNHPEKHDIYLGTAFWLKVIGAFSVMILLAFIVPLASSDSTANLFIFIVSSGLVFQSFEVVVFYFQSQVLAKNIFICQIIQLTLSSTIKIYLVFTEATLIWFVLITAFDSLILALNYFLAYKFSKKPSFYKYFNLQVAKQLLNDSWPLIFSVIIVMLYMRIDQVMIQHILGSYETGLYSAAIKISEVWYFLPTVIAASFFPSILKAKNTNKLLYVKRLQYLYIFSIWSAIIISLTVTFLGEWLIVALYGEAYKQASAVLIIHSWGMIFVFIGVITGRFLLAENLSIITLKRTFFGLIINIFLNSWSIPKFGLLGAATSTLIAQISANYIFDIFNKSLHSQFKLKTKAFIFPLIYLKNCFPKKIN